MIDVLIDVLIDDDSAVPGQSVLWKIVKTIIFIVAFLVIAAMIIIIIVVRLRRFFHCMSIKDIIGLINNRNKDLACMFIGKKYGYYYHKHKMREPHYISEWEENEPNNITEIWLSHAPPVELSNFLLRVFANHKPTIYIGCVMQYSEEDRERLKDLLYANFNIQPWEDVSNARGKNKRYTLHLMLYIHQLEEEIKLPLGQQNNYMNRSRDVVAIACVEEGVTHLLTNRGKLYRSTPGDFQNHAEGHFIGDQQEIQNVDTIWIKNSPCEGCLDALINCYGIMNIKKPKVKVGRIYKLKDNPIHGQYFEKMVEFYVKGFEISLWEDFVTQWFVFSPKLFGYIKEVRKEAVKRGHNDKE